MLTLPPRSYANTKQSSPKAEKIKEVEILIAALSAPCLIGVYENSAKIAEFASAEGEKADKFLIAKFSEILKTYKIKELIYANTPGSFMGMKVSYVILRTLSIALDVPLYAVSGFGLSGFGPIRANKNFSYVYEHGEIRMKKCAPAALSLPQDLSVLNKSDDILPNYIIEAV